MKIKDGIFIGVIFSKLSGKPYRYCLGEDATIKEFDRLKEKHPFWDYRIFNFTDDIQREIRRLIFEDKGD